MRLQPIRFLIFVKKPIRQIPSPAEAYDVVVDRLSSCEGKFYTNAEVLVRAILQMPE